jgi:hypothetical protein
VITVGECRPYPETGLTTELWIATVKIEWVLWSSVITTQSGVTIHGMLSEVPRGADAWPHIVVYQGVSYLEDGHTRMVKSILAGKVGADCRVFRPWPTAYVL